MEYCEFRDRRRGCNGIQNIGILLLVAGVGIFVVPMYIANGSLGLNAVYGLMIAGFVLLGIGGLVMLSGRKARDGLQWDVEKNSRVYSYGGEPRFARYGSHRPHKHELENNDDEDDEETVVQSRNRQREELQGAFGFSKPNLHI